ncbi:PSP1 domain-containing protein [Desulfobacca acetoxidans]|uniref:PSP1 domain protein n=1 Tax=Desulfobacca acetoxidans (strain ATCC 700848 / DSM 11109 / ASRB2) TaxID=880072 RepID=F2NDA7_DESAR|nr:stage 0 sporulation family protein [Desulfobacca acetoxidans]AEB09973.1 PSP1 domain protein [Desulfobacca acetoxidans DSM 11109]
MSKIVRVRFRPHGKVYNFDSGHFVLSQGNHVIVETEQGVAFGTVVSPPQPRSPKLMVQPLKPVYRLATAEDIEQQKLVEAREQKAFEFCQHCIQTRQLPMHLVRVEGLFDTSKMVFYFTAAKRVDFRELVRDLVQQFRTRIELRQIGVRHQAKMIGGLGNCGRPFCCSTFLQDFAPVSVRMAKEQNLSLNPSKISGCCGRLMCCLTYEYQTYMDLKAGLPKIGKKIMLPEGEAKIIRQNIINQTITVELSDGREVEVPMSQVDQEDPALLKRGIKLPETESGNG